MPTILLINDDGIHAAGLMAIKKKLAKLGKVVVVAPKQEISGIGKAITSTHVQIQVVKLSDGSEAYAINGGTPADAYLLAVHKILKHPPDIVVTGINLGPNLGIDDFLNSGTLGAALEAAIHGVPAVALSYCKCEIDDQKAAKSGITLQELEPTASIGQKIVAYVLKKGLPQDTDLISVNVPENADGTKLKITSLSYTGYGDLFTKEDKGYRIAHWKLADYKYTQHDSDVHVVRDEGCVSITPVRIRMHHNKKGSELMLKEAFGRAADNRTP
jgi:5'-nucleotidase